LAEVPALIHSTIVLMQEPGTLLDLPDPGIPAGMFSRLLLDALLSGVTPQRCRDVVVVAVARSTMEPHCGATSSPQIQVAHLVSSTYYLLWVSSRFMILIRLFLLTS